MKKLICLLVLSHHLMAETKDIFLFKKSYNPKNVLHYSIKLSEDCQFQAFPDGAYVNPYWIMGEENGQIESITKLERKAYLPLIKSIDSSRTKMEINLSAINEIKNPLVDLSISILAQRTQKGCVAFASMNIDGQEVTLEEFYVEGKFNMLLSWKTNYLLIKGRNQAGLKVSKKLEP
jgi:hypothetical protein